jgi:hypothetical protein
MWIHPSYRLGNIIDAWYGQHNAPDWGQNQEDASCLARNFQGTFGQFLATRAPSDLVQNPTPKFLKEAARIYWWGSLEIQKSIHPWLGRSIRSAVKEFFQDDARTPSTPDTCVIHLRVGDMLVANPSEFKLQYIFDATDKLPRTPDRFEILNGGKFHNTGHTGPSETLLHELASGIQKKFPDAIVTHVESQNADLDFCRMVVAPMLITGVGSFAIMAAVANENFRLTPALSQMDFYDRKVIIEPENVYDGWYTYSVR